MTRVLTSASLGGGPVIAVVIRLTDLRLQYKQDLMARLNLKYEPNAANAPKFAADIAEAAADISGAELDYSVDSLNVVDGIIAGFAADGLSSEQMAETLFGFGCYIGETMVRMANATWIDTPDDMIDMMSFPLVVRLRDDSICNPIGKAFKRLDNGEGDSIVFFYRAFTSKQKGG